MSRVFGSLCESPARPSTSFANATESMVQLSTTQLADTFAGTESLARLTGLVSIFMLLFRAHLTQSNGHALLCPRDILNQEPQRIA